MFKLIFILSCALSCSFACRTIEGKANGVVQVQRSENPWHVLVETFIAFEQKYLCSGALIHPQFVLTTTKCVFGNLFVNLHVYAFNLEDEFEDEREIFRSTETIMHPDYDGIKNLHDLALVKFKNPLNLATKSYAIVNLPLVSETLNVGDMGTVSAWGFFNYEKDFASNIRHSQQMMVQSEADCATAYGPFTAGNEGRVCIRRTTGTNCVSDSGALFIRNGKLFGILSFGQDQACDTAGAMNGMQDIRAHLDWINTEIA